MRYGVGHKRFAGFLRRLYTQLVHSSAYADYIGTISYTYIIINRIHYIYQHVVCIVVNARVLENTVAHTLYGRRIRTNSKGGVYLIRRRSPSCSITIGSLAYVCIVTRTMYTARALVKFVYAS